MKILLDEKDASKNHSDRAGKFYNTGVYFSK